MSDCLCSKSNGGTMAPNESSKEDLGRSRPAKSALGLPQRLADCDPATKEKIRQKVKSDIFANPAAMMPYVFYNLSLYTFLLPEHWGLQPPDFVQALQSVLVDLPIMKYFEESGIINWSKAAAKLYPLRTTGDGNCLMHAISLFLWGIEDLDLQMRRILYQDIFNDNQVKRYQKRWQIGRTAFDQGIPSGGLRYDTMNWDDEWKLVIRNASPEPNPEGQQMLPYHSLEEIHIFIMANILKRPIIVLADTMFRDSAGRSLQPQNVTGIYLPVITKPEDCVPYPIVLGYHQNHFVPLVGKRMLPEEVSDMVLPLCTKNLEGFPVHFLLPDEEASKPRLLEAYLRQKQLTHTGNSHTMLALQSAELGTKELSESASIMKTYIRLAEKNYQAGFKSEVGKTSISHPMLMDPPKSQSGKPSGIKLCCMCSKNPADGDNDVCKECLVKNCTSFHPTASAPPESIQIGDASKQLGNLKLEGIRSYNPESELRVPPQNPVYQSPVGSQVTGGIPAASNYALPEYSICMNRPCKTPGCQFYCSSQLPGDYCHSCSKEAPVGQLAKLEKCRTPGCITNANPERQGLCDICSGSQHLMKQGPLNVVGYDPLPSTQIPTVSEFRPSYQGRTNVLEDPSGLDSLAILQTNVGSKKCIEPLCKLTGQDTLQGFCSKCYKKNFKIHKHVENIPQEKPSNHLKQGSLEGVTSAPRLQSGGAKVGSSRSLEQPAVTHQITSGPLRCRTEKCDLFGTREQNGYCTKCLNEVLRQEHQDLCKSRRCSRKVFCDGYCRECYENTPNLIGVNIQSETHFQSEALTGIAHHSGVSCITTGCQNVIVMLGDGRHCYNCYQAQASRTQPQFQQVKCVNTNCDKPTPADQPLCVGCQHFFDAQKSEEALKANTMSPSPSSALKIPCKKCRKSFAGHDGFCNECRHTKFYGDLYNTGLTKKEEFISSQGKNLTCTSPGCAMYGNPDFQGYCSKCFNMKQTRPKESSRSAPVKPSPRMLQDEPYTPRHCVKNCGNWANVQVLDGLCNDCYQLYNTEYPRRRLAQSATVQEPSVYRPEMRNRNRTDQKCFNEHCSNRGNPGAKGYCNSCFRMMHLDRY